MPGSGKRIRIMLDNDCRRDISEPMSDKTFARFSRFIQAEIGIKMPGAKKTMLQARLQKRLWKLGISSFDEYCDYLFSSEGMENELPHMIDVVTTNKTEFFREPKHFEYLIQHVLPDLIERKGLRERLMVWCAGCSTGEEAYSLAMVLSEFADQTPGFQFFILGTDISTKVLEQAQGGIYEQERIETVPTWMRKRYLLKSRDQAKPLVRIVPELRTFVRFRRLNFMDKHFGLREPMDIIFCRNVIIYFDRLTQETVLNRICRYLNPEGYLFTGHSETLSGMNLPLIPVAHTVYQRTVITDHHTDLPVIYLKPAELWVTDRPTIVRTVLGSCLAVTMFNHRLGVSAACHALLPHHDKKEPRSTNPSERFKYVDRVIPEMVARMRDYGIRLEGIEVKVFGGADMLSSQIEQDRNQPVGKLNVEMALKMIEAEGLQLKASDVGGAFGRKIFFYTHTGEVLLKRLRSGIFPPQEIPYQILMS
jgi:chemotaxis protein methyltransferase CheR